MRPIPNPISVFFGFLLLSGFITPVSAAFSHPGILHTASELAATKAKVAANQQPWKGAYEAMLASNYGKSTYSFTPFDTVMCGSYNNPNVGCNEIVYDGMAAYTNALIYSLGGPQAHADKAMAILDGWSAKYRANTESNARLVVSWAAPWYTNAAELIRASNAGWSAAKITQFKGMLNRWLPYVKDESMPGNNWIQSAIEAHIAMAIFLDEQSEYDAAVDRWNFRVTTYIYQTTDGSTPINTPGKTDAQMKSIWEGQATSTIYVNGLAMETCRDLGHLKLGFNSMMYAAEAAWHQGQDVFTPHKKRLTDFLELHGKWMTGSEAVPTNICDGVVRTSESDPNSGVKPPNGGGQIAWEIAYNHLHDRLNSTLTYTKQMIDESRPTSAARWVTKWETLTHAGRSFAVAQTKPTISIVLPVTSSLTVQPGYNLEMEADAGDVDGDLVRVVLFIDGDSIRAETTTPYQWGHTTSPDPAELHGLVAGNHQLVVRAIDATGLTASDTLRLVVQDNTTATLRELHFWELGKVRNFDLIGRRGK